MIRYLRLRVIGTLLTVIYLIMVFLSLGKGFRDAIIVTAIVLFFISGISEIKQKNK